MDLVSAHILAFPNQDGPKLVIKTVNGASHRTQEQQLLYAAAERADILVFDEYLSREQMHALVNECETYISLHRSEGYGLTIAEAMSLGKPVVATGYSGNMDFMNEENSILVPFKITSIGPGSEPYPQDSVWAQPDINFAAKAIRELHENASLRSSLGEKGRHSVQSEFTLERAANFVLSRVEENYRFTKPGIGRALRRKT